ncbi:hypothetical protein A2483_01830 [Candidatus Peregrinibacteria bacterium RIFOXYC2_FULL_33_13]|nr:MAG: Glycosyl transferase family 2 [Candidatus Peregrinibacteria bacterium GW2011_GWA2_33_10]KKP39761.1 MAG: family 2 glycosyl transferase [Candidatus Peregrinibacteria bacterium GW2011_GWC2_33_13]OGJ50449.1 MAG: hypothetical protein A2229_02510 [Candidatus Peregrinibacteria bacterium RIFOXYA2_FULL_33_7]OGJ52631.1 MAG: hypothetical protein A2483_01830 [Candidatus Peregrinibacteria bacterium RIFOXYC2_FULL_33_13]
MDLSIIILQHNSSEDTTKCLESFKKAVLPEETEFIVVNNGGNNANDKILEDSYKSLNIKFSDIPNKGFANGNNEGLKLASGKFCAFVNPDIIVEIDTVKILMEYFKKQQSVGIVAPQLYYPNGKIQDNFRVFPKFRDLIIKRTRIFHKIFLKRLRKYLLWDKDPNKNFPVDWVTGAFMIVKRECLEKVNNHDERLFLFMSDLVMCRDAWDNGFEVHFVGVAKALHHESRLSGGNIFDIFRKKSLRIHIIDAFKYYFIYKFKKFPINSPSGKRE